MSQRNANVFQNDGGISRPTARVSQDVGDEKIAKVTSVVLNPKNLKMYQIAFVIIFILYIWLTEFSSVALIIKSLFIVALVALMIIESIIILSYIE